jgi:hypothetical protein
MLEKIELVDRIEVIENGCVQVRTKTAIMEDGKQMWPVIMLVLRELTTSALSDK